MPSVFISYRRRPSAMLATLIARELGARGIDAYVDTRQTDGGGPFPDRLLHAIEQQDVFVCLVAGGTFESEWVRREIAHAHALGKPMIPVFQESYVPITDPPDEAIATLLHYDGIHMMDVRNIYIDEALDDLVTMITQSAPRRERPSRRLGRGTAVIASVAVVAALALVAAVIAFSGDGGSNGNGDSGDPTATEAGAALAYASPPPNTSPTEDDAYSSGTNAEWEAERVTYNDIGFVNVPPDCFEMGVDDAGDASPAHIVCLDNEYWIAEYPVTNAEYARCVDDGDCTPPADTAWFDDLYAYGDYPVVYVSWQQAQDYADWLGGSLLTEAQWEYAARGPDGWRYASGNFTPRCDSALTSECTGGEMVAVTAASGTSWVGAYAMTGGVWEWVADWYGQYTDEDWIDNPTGPDSGDRRVVRGGSYDAPIADATTTIRVALDPGTQSAHTGFRIGINWDLREAAE